MTDIKGETLTAPVPKVYTAINAIQKALSTIGIAKTSKNTQQGYAFRGIDAVYGALAPLLAEHGLCILPRVVQCDRTERTTIRESVLFYTILRVEFDFVAVVDGSLHTVTTVGEAMDSGDKATNKAMSAAYKYACFQAFSIPTEGEDNDADRVTHPEIKAGKPKTSSEGSQPDAPADTASQTVAALPQRPPYKDNWRDHVVHFGKNAGSQLKELKPEALEWYQTKWLPKPYNGKWNEKDLALRDALDASLSDPATNTRKPAARRAAKPAAGEPAKQDEIPM